jgi:hypothetical protein
MALNELACEDVKSHGRAVDIRDGQQTGHTVRTGSGAHPAYYPMGTGGPFLGGKAAGALS